MSTNHLPESFILGPPISTGLTAGLSSSAADTRYEFAGTADHVGSSTVEVITAPTPRNNGELKAALGGSDRSRVADDVGEGSGGGLLGRTEVRGMQSGRAKSHRRSKPPPDVSPRMSSLPIVPAADDQISHPAPDDIMEKDGSLHRYPPGRTLSPPPAATRERQQESEINALHNLPPPLPFHLRVSDLSIGVPPSRTSSYIPSFIRKRRAKTSGTDTALTPNGREAGGGPGDVQADNPASGEEAEGGGRKRWILRGAECECRSGEVLAILGGSGSGKTTLLNQIAHRGSGLPVESGEIVYRAGSIDGGDPAPTHVMGDGDAAHAPSTETIGAKMSKREMKSRIGFVRQQDFLVEHLTVRETLTYAAQLRLPPSLPQTTIRLIVEQTIDELGLRDAADTLVGSSLRKGISGGEKRRLSIGCVLVTLPSVLILDEPTSGLDAFTSYLLLLTLSQLARRGRTVILSIHAPRSDAFEVFDRVALLSKGEVVYSGKRRECLAWFKILGHEVEVGVNPLDFLIDISSVDNRTVDAEEESRARVRHLINAWKSRSPGQLGRQRASRESTVSLLSDVEAKSDDGAPTSPEQQTVGVPALNRQLSIGHLSTTSQTEAIARDERRPGPLRQTRVLIARSHKNVYRNFAQLAGLVVQGAILGVIMGFTFYQLPETATGVQSLKNLSFQLIPGVFYLQQVFWIYKYTTDLVIFDREREDHLYDIVPYIFSDWLSTLLPSVVAPSIYVILVYFMAGLRMDNLAANLFTLIADVVLVQFCTQGLSLLASCITRSFATASVIGNALNLFQIVSAGFIVTNVPPYVWWVRWISPYFYSFRIMSTTQLRDRVFDCPPESRANLAQCIGNNVLSGLNFDYRLNIGIWFGGMLGLALAEYILVCLILSVWHGGGVKHASEIESHHRGKTADVTQSHMTRDEIDVEVRNLCLKWEKRGLGHGLGSSKSKTILDDVSIKFPAGEISAILGPSGAGKSTLLQLLAARQLGTSALARFSLTGQILLAGQPATAAAQSNIAFVEQDDDWHLPRLTVRETLRYAAILRLPDKMPRRQKIARAETVLLMLGLKDCADLPVGGAVLKGISGGEKRRLSLAVQMINDPAVLLVDEPTSGLDASIALSVMQVLKDIASTGRTVIATIHQPRSDIWQLADNVTLLAKGGRVAFSGKRDRAVNFFASAGYPMPSEYFNPADHLLDIVSVDPRVSKHEASQARVQGMVARWRQKEPHADSAEDTPAEVGAVVDIKREKRSTGMLVAFPVVLERHWKNLWRQKDVFFSRLIQIPLLGGLFILFFQRLSRGPSGAQDRIGLTIQTTTPIPFVGLLNAMAIFPADRNLYLYECKSSARYSAATFVLVYTLVEVGFEVLGCMGFAAIMNVGTGMQTSARIYFQFATTIWAMVHMGESLAIIVGSWIMIEGITVTVVSTLLSIIGQFSGAISLSTPNWLAAIAWAFVMKEATRIQIINESIGLVFNCSPEEVQSGVCVAQTGEQLLALFDFSDLDVNKFTGIIVAVAIAWRIIAWLVVCARVGGFR